MTIRRSQKLVLLVALVLLLSVNGAVAREWSAEYEEKIGAEAVAQVEEEYTRYEDEEALQRTQTIVAAIVPHTQRPEVEYDIRLLDSDEVNSFSCPGGHIYVTKGLFEAVESDAELAGVMAHEIAHNCTYDALDQLKRAKNLSMATAAAVVAAIVLGRGDEMVYGTLYAGQITTRGILSKYSLEIESRADHNAIEYLLATDEYNPVGFLTFMERLARKERRRPDPQLGIFQTHPYGPQRVRGVLEQLEEADVEINRRAVSKWEPPTLEETQIGEQSAWAVTLWEQQIFVYNYAPGDEEPKARGERIVQVLTKLLAEGAESYEFRIRQGDEHPTVVVRGRTVVTVYPEDAALEEMTAAQKAQAVCQNIRAALYAEKINRLY